jgi:hypothetical protein
MSVQALQHHPEYVMILQARKENHTVSDRTAGRNTDPTASRTAVHDPSVSAGFVRNAESRMKLRTVYPTDREYQQTNNNNFIPIVVLWQL